MARRHCHKKHACTMQGFFRVLQTGILYLTFFSP